MLLKKQKNELFEIAAKCGINHAQLTTGESKMGLGFTIALENSPFKFEIKIKDPKSQEIQVFHYKFAPIPAIHMSTGWDGSVLWEDILIAFTLWAELIAEEVATPDLWAEAASTAQLFGSPAAPDEKFTDYELRELQSQLRAVENKLAATSLPEAAIRELTAALREAAPKAESMTKKDWQNMVIGAIVNNISTLVLSAEHVQAVYQILKATFNGWLLH